MNTESPYCVTRIFIYYLVRELSLILYILIKYIMAEILHVYTQKEE